MKTTKRFIKTRVNNWSAYTTYEILNENGKSLGFVFERYGIDNLPESVLNARKANEKKLSVNRLGTVDYEKIEKKSKKSEKDLNLLGLLNV